MVRKDGAEVRKQRIMEVRQAIHRFLFSKTEVDLNEVLAALQYQTGLTREKLLEYIGIIEATHQIVVDYAASKILTVDMADRILNAAAKEPFNPNLSHAKPLRTTEEPRP